MKDKILLDDINSKSLNELTDIAGKIIEKLEKTNNLESLSEDYQKLIKLNLIEKTIAPLDKRSYKIYLTKRGKTLYQDLNNKINFYFQDIYSELGFKKVDDLADILSAINWQFEILHNE